MPTRKIKMNQNKPTESLSIKLTVSYEQAVEKVTAALKTQGFGVLTEIDVQATLKKKLDVNFRRYVILGACNPTLAHRALSASLDVGLLLPCNVVVYEDDGGSVVAAQDPIVMLQVIDNPTLVTIAQEARARLAQAIDELGKGE